MASASSVAATVGSAAVVAVGSTEAVVGSTAGVSVAADPQAVSMKLIRTITNMNERTNLVISIFSPNFFVRSNLINQLLRTKEEQVNVLLRKKTEFNTQSFWLIPGNRFFKHRSVS